MGHTLTRNYDTDRSRTDVESILNYVAHTFNADIPTQTAFETPDIMNEDENLFAVPVRPTVTDAGIDVGDLLYCDVNVRGKSVVMVGSVDNDDGTQTAHVKVSEGNSTRCTDIEKFEN